MTTPIAQGPVDVIVRPHLPTKTRDVIFAPHAQFAGWCHGPLAYAYGATLAAAAVCRENALLAHLGDALARLPVEGEDDCITQAREFMVKMMGSNASYTADSQGLQTADPAEFPNESDT